MYLLTACINGRYGVNCMERCSDHCGIPGMCNRETGGCKGGCQTGWKKPKCEASKEFHRVERNENMYQVFSEVL